MGKSFKTVCTVSSQDRIEVDFLSNNFGFDFFNGDSNIGGVLVSVSEAERLIEYLQEKIKEVREEERKRLVAKVKKGVIINSVHIESGTPYSYKVVVERVVGDCFRLINVKNDMIMADFKTTDPERVISYIEGLGNGHRVVSIINQ
jgi:hypothetical protein